MVFTPPVPPGVARCISVSTIKFIGANPSYIVEQGTNVRYIVVPEIKFCKRDVHNKSSIETLEFAAYKLYLVMQSPLNKKKTRTPKSYINMTSEC